MISVANILDQIDQVTTDALSVDAMRCNPDAEEREPEMWAWIASAYGDVPGIVNMDAYQVGRNATMRVAFDNGRFASVAPNRSAIIPGRYEVALVEADGHVVYGDGFTDVVWGLDDAGVIETLRRVSALPPTPRLRAAQPPKRFRVVRDVETPALIPGDVVIAYYGPAMVAPGTIAVRFEPGGSWFPVPAAAVEEA